jgi:hypothetical protein
MYSWCFAGWAAPRGTIWCGMVDYRRFDQIDVSDDEEEERVPPQRVINTAVSDVGRNSTVTLVSIPHRAT